MEQRGEQRATRDSWKIIPMPAAQGHLQIDRTFSEEDYQRLSKGRIPQAMEDKWFIYLDGDWLSFHRSWTGYCIYRVRLDRRESTHHSAEAWANRDVTQYSYPSDDEDAANLLFLIDVLLLGRPVSVDRAKIILQHYRLQDAGKQDEDG